MTPDQEAMACALLVMIIVFALAALVTGDRR